MLFVPGWDMTFIALGLTVLVYSCIIGRDWTAKIILATYAAILATDAFGLFFEHILMSDQYIDLARSFPDRSGFLAIWKLGFFSVFLVAFARKVGYSLEINNSGSRFLQLGSQAIYGVMSAILIVSAVLVYTTGSSFIFGAFGPGITSQVATTSLYQEAGIIQLIYENAHWIFVLPAALLLFRIK